MYVNIVENIFCKEVIDFIRDETTRFSYLDLPYEVEFNIIKNKDEKLILGGITYTELEFIELINVNKEGNEILFNLLKEYHPEYVI